MIQVSITAKLVTKNTGRYLTDKTKERDKESSRQCKVLGTVTFTQAYSEVKRLQ